MLLALLPPISCPDSLDKNPVSNKSSDSLSVPNLSESETLKDKWFTRDKFHHFSYSLGITGLSYHVYHCQFNNPNPGARYFAISIAALTGIGKELYDKYYKKSKISYKDLVADAAGIVTGVFLFTTSVVLTR